MYERLLISTDGSENMERVIKSGITIADQLGVPVHALSVIPNVVTRDHLAYDPETAAENAVEELEQKCRERGIAVDTEIRKGDPVEEILNCSEENNIDIIILGTHGRTGLDHAVIGSVAEQVVRRAPVPVMTVRSEK
jgi:nucleotide-binding universal stress UspA family protein